MDFSFAPHFLVLVLVLVAEPSVQEDCERINDCSCKNSQGTIDLKPLDSGGGEPKFKDVQSSDAGQNKFSWNPCTAFSEGSGSCTNVAVCQIQPGFLTNFINIGLQETATFQNDPEKGLELRYSSNIGGVLRVSHVFLVCERSDGPGVVTAEGENQDIPANYYLTYTGVFACPVKATGGGMSAGSVLLIIFFVALCVYLIGGVLYQTFVKKASGQEVIPHYSFWVDLPVLVKDGACFLVQKGKIHREYTSVS